MKKRRYLPLLGLLLAPLFWTGCDDDDNAVTYWVSLATVDTPEDSSPAPEWFPIGSSQPFYFTLDNGRTLYPQYINSFLIGYRINEGNRALIGYWILSGQKAGYDNAIELLNIGNVLTKPIYTLTADTAATSHLRGDAPVDVDEMWIGDGFINVTFEYLGSPGSTHYINMIVNAETGPQPNPSGDKWFLEFVHDRSGDTGGRKYKGIVSFRIPSTLAADVTQIDVSWKDLDGRPQSEQLVYDRNATSGGTAPKEIGGLTSESYK